MIEPYVHPACGVLGIRVLEPEEVHEVVIGIIGPLEIEDPNDPFVQRVIDRTNALNKGCFGNRRQFEQQLWNEFRDEWYEKYRERFLNRNKQANCEGGQNRSKDCEGLVAVCYKDGEPVTPPITDQRERYIVGANEYIVSQGRPAIRMSTQGALRKGADRAAERERRDNPGKYPQDPVRFPNGPAAGHVPDTTWTGPVGQAEPFTWEALDSKLNASIGGQAGAYPLGYRALAFVPGEWGPKGCQPGVTPRGLASPPPYGPVR
ncbi:hypothetical protein BJY24_000100 [Nocardia transvalensis]|uniref:Uncharacterized protein n=1 Tax=Nocardia transvalensis TaxID=37333 RepID=A0A7W9P8N8_9NOCA|nr:hypothetical protein [Nocardia transvalensis]MBB5911233.1 hypothetical protein [Nocardia transvalensis]